MDTSKEKSSDQFEFYYLVNLQSTHLLGEKDQ